MIAPGKYELQLQYFLYPSDAVLTLRQNFTITEIPKHEEEAFKDYVDHVYYCNQTHIRSNLTYDSDHVDSHINFVKKHPNSRFAQWTQMRMHVGGYPNDDKEIGDVLASNEYVKHLEFIQSINRRKNYTR